MTKPRLITIAMTGSLLIFGAGATGQTPNGLSDGQLQTVEQMMSNGDTKSAVKILEGLWETNDQNLELCQLLVDAYGNRIDEVSLFKKKGLAKKMLGKMEQCYALDPEDETAQMNLIRFHMEAPSMVGGDKDVAKKIIDTVSIKNPERAFMMKARLAMAEDDLPAASEFANEALKLNPGNAETLNVAGLIAQRQGQYDDATALFERCVSADVDQFDCQYQIGKTAHLSGTHTEKGIAAFQAFIQNGHENPEYLAHAHYRLAELFLIEGNDAEAIPHLEAAIEIADLKSAKKSLAKLK